MNRTYLMAIVAALLAAPFAMAHTPAGTPKNYCEPPADWLIHDYGPPATGFFILLNEDGNLGGDCSGAFDPGYVCAGVDPEDPLNTFLVGVCDFDPPLADWDGHNEFALGGAWLLVNSGNGEPSANPSVGAGTLYCFGAVGHHASFPTVTVDDLFLGGGGEATVASDTTDLTGTGEGCGDFESDQAADGVGTVTPTFGPGLDGAYVVYVRGSMGHVSTN